MTLSKRNVRGLAGVRALRNALRLTQSEVARRAGLSQGYLSQLENGDVGSPSIDIVARLAHGLQVPVHHLLRCSGISCGHSVRDLEPQDAERELAEATA